MSHYIPITEADREQARQTDLVAFLRQCGETVFPSGSEFQWKHRGEKITIRGNVWYNQYTQTGGDAISFAQEFYDYSYPDAVMLIRTLDFKTRSHQRSLFNPTDISKEVYEISKQLFAELWDGVSPLRLMGISLTNITKEDTPQLTLFQDDRREKASKLDKATDALNARFGTATIVRGSSMQAPIEVDKKHRAQLELGTKKQEK